MLRHPLRTNRIKALAITISIAAALIAAGIVFAAPVLVDHFDSGPQFLTAAVPSGGGSASVFGTITATTSLGGERDAVLTSTGGSEAATRKSDYEIIIGQGQGVLSIASDPFVQAQAHIEWDGADGNALSLNTTGLGGADLTDVSTDDAFRISILFDDLPGIQGTVRVYTGTRSAQYQFTFPGGIASGARVDFIAPFSAFTPSGGWTNADWQHVGAITLDIDGRPAAGADFVIELIETTGSREYGDLPSPYGTLITDTLPGPSHQILTGLRLGNSLDAELDGHPSLLADGDNLDQALPDDEDGVTRFPGFNWSVAGGGRILYTVKGCNNNLFIACYVHGWIDFNRDGDFNDAGENMMNVTTLGDTFNLHAFAIPAGTTFPATSNTFYARFRVCGGVGGSDDCGSPNGPAGTGEVEDYAWNFGPLAVTLESLHAQPTTSPIVPVALVGVSALALISVVFYIRRKKTA
jgi:hypothetical protein